MNLHLVRTNAAALSVERADASRQILDRLTHLANGRQRSWRAEQSCGFGQAVLGHVVHIGTRGIVGAFQRLGHLQACFHILFAGGQLTRQRGMALHHLAKLVRLIVRLDELFFRLQHIVERLFRITGLLEQDDGELLELLVKCIPLLRREAPLGEGVAATIDGSRDVRCSILTAAAFTSNALRASTSRSVAWPTLIQASVQFSDSVSSSVAARS
ncbi:hypothetical protein [Bradyrhizobium sp. SZCCHNS3051]|uniref:hypothetical protein n=1 Tax=Bradyrhizobium sp. SZCCHNS3051 TaxID=3057320 RepID=UPI0029161712|nr:hypothetical protein [Bradyrhizobium sp. SZCCHNS3051]